MESTPAQADDKSAWPWLTAALFSLATLGIVVARSIQRCGGHFGYPMDDTYIHMAMARSFSLHGVWGITRYGFSSSTSSPLYTLILSACYALTGVREITPLALNILAGAGLLFWCDRAFTWAGFQAKQRLWLLLLLTFAVPLPILMLGGMEHVLHALLTLIFAHLCCEMLAQSESTSRATALMLVSGAALVVVRYEALFLLLAAGALFLVRRRWKTVIGLSVAMALPTVAYGAVCWAHGWFPLPTSLLLKANLPSSPAIGLYPGFFPSLLRNAFRGSHVLTLVGIAGLLLLHSWRKFRTLWSYHALSLMLFVVTATLHLTLARTGWFFRYEAYLVAFGLFSAAVALQAAGSPAQLRLFIALVGLVGSLLTARTVYAFWVASQAVTDIYDQQYQMGLFVRENLNTQAVLLHDIGAVSFLSDARVLDIVGLGSLDPALARLRNQYSSSWLTSWAQREHAAVAILYPMASPPEWRPVASWAIPGNYMSGADSVNFFALDAASSTSLIRALEHFRPRLPERVVVKMAGSK